jgi:phytol kinase
MSGAIVPSAWIGIAILVAALLSMLALLRVASRRYGLHPELSRKLAHVGLGLATLTFPWLFDETWPVLLVAGLAVATLVSLRHVPALRSSVGGVVNGVDRASFGDLYFPIAGAGLFVLARGDKLLFSVPILTLAFADAVAALIGVAYGQYRYDDAEGGKKSLEGSIAFFLVAFLATHIPVLLFSSVGRAESLLIGLTFGMLVMLLEAVAWRGLDNLFIPFGGFLLLKAFLALDAAALVARLAVTTFLIVLVVAMRKRRTLSDSAVLAGVLIGYIAWSVGGWQWLVPPLILFVAYTVLWPRAAYLRDRPHDMIAVFSVTGCGILWLLLASVLREPALYYAYTLSFAANLCFIGISWWRQYRRHTARWRGVALSALSAWLTFFVPYVLVLSSRSTSLRPVLIDALVALAPLILSGAALLVVVPHRPNRPLTEFPWARQALLSLAASGLGLAAVLSAPVAGSMALR